MNTTIRRQQALLILDLQPADTDREVIFEVVNSARSNMVNSRASTHCDSADRSKTNEMQFDQIEIQED